MILSLFYKKNLICIDGDGTFSTTTAPYAKRFNYFLKNGMEIYPVQIFHYSAIHYMNRHKFIGKRWLNAYLNAAIYGVEDKSKCLVLNINGDHELQGNSSEVIGVGLSTYAMCTITNEKLSCIKKIISTEKRCDFELITSSYKIVYESRGRNSYNKVSSAVSDLDKKKKSHSADYKYGVVTAIPRDGKCVRLYFYDPPGDKYISTQYEYYFSIALHYIKVLRLSGIHILANAMEKRLLEINRQERWIEGELENVSVDTKTELNFEVNGTRYIYNQNEFNYRNDFYQFAIDSQLIDFFIKWNFETLDKFYFKDKVLPEDGISIASDGSLFHIKMNNNNMKIR